LPYSLRSFFPQISVLFLRTNILLLLQMKKSAVLFKISCVITVVPFLLSSCNNVGSNNKGTDDSLQICSVLQKMYKWHDANGQNIPDFEIIVKDTLQVGVDTTELVVALNELKKTNFFTDNFLKNYEQIGRQTDYKLKHDSVKYLNEINFSFQDADPWTFFQDDAGKYWDSLKIRRFAINADTASLRWSVDLVADTLGYLVKLKRENKEWKIDYLEGFDLAHCFFERAAPVAP
jgi:hypothetical protein